LGLLSAFIRIHLRFPNPNKTTNQTNMKTRALFYHAGCPVCVAAEQNLAAALDPARFEVEVVHLGQYKHRVAEAERAGVKSVPALVLDGQPYHINFGASLDALK
jgi:glutaredoxin